MPAARPAWRSRSVSPIMRPAAGGRSTVRAAKRRRSGGEAAAGAGEAEELLERQAEAGGAERERLGGTVAGDQLGQRMLEGVVDVGGGVDQGPVEIEADERKPHHADRQPSVNAHQD